MAYEHAGYNELVAEMQMAFPFLSGQREFQAVHRRLAGPAAGISLTGWYLDEKMC